MPLVGVEKHLASSFCQPYRFLWIAHDLGDLDAILSKELSRRLAALFLLNLFQHTPRSEGRQTENKYPYRDGLVSFYASTPCSSLSGRRT